MNLDELEHLDLRGNPIFDMADDTFDENVNMKTFQIDVINICPIFGLMKSSPTIEVHWKYILTLNTTCVDDSLQIHAENNELVIRVGNNEHPMRFTKDKLENLESVIFGPNLLKNTTKIIGMLGSSILFLEITGNIIGAVSRNMFDRFNGLFHLCLSGTNLTFSGFNPFEKISEDFEDRPNNKKLEHYDNANQNIVNAAEAVEVDPPNDGPAYNHLQLSICSCFPCLINSVYFCALIIIIQ